MSREQAFEMLIKIFCKTDSTDDMKLNFGMYSN